MIKDLHSEWIEINQEMHRWAQLHEGIEGRLGKD
jgi:hypothetical protein